MLREKLGLSTEPQPVFVGACFTLLMLLMQFDFIFISHENGALVQLFNTPYTLTRVMINSAKNDVVNTISWIIEGVAPILMFIFAAIIGKKHAKLLIIPAALLALRSAMNLVFGAYIFSYNVMSWAYIVTAVIYIIATITKKSLPFFIYCMIFSVLVLFITLIRKGPFVTFDNDILISPMVYFISYHIAVGNFARAIPMQATVKENKKKKDKEDKEDKE
jgi:hypothetical protein